MKNINIIDLFYLSKPLHTYISPPSSTIEKLTLTKQYFLTNLPEELDSLYTTLSLKNYQVTTENKKLIFTQGFKDYYNIFINPKPNLSNTKIAPESLENLDTNTLTLLSKLRSKTQKLLTQTTTSNLTPQYQLLILNYKTLLPLQKHLDLDNLLLLETNINDYQNKNAYINGFFIAHQLFTECIQN